MTRLWALLIMRMIMSISSCSEESRMLSVSTLAGILHTPLALDHFAHFVSEQHTEENLLFVLDVEEYHMREGEKKMGQEIYEKVSAGCGGWMHACMSMLLGVSSVCMRIGCCHNVATCMLLHMFIPPVRPFWRPSRDRRLPRRASSHRRDSSHRRHTT